MQRFGTASIPTHSIGLALLKSDWHQAVSLILSKRPGEHPEVEAARDAWLVDGDLDKALEMMPRRVVAERCILENYQKQGGETRNAMGALSTVSAIEMKTVPSYELTCCFKLSRFPAIYDSCTCMPISRTYGMRLSPSAFVCTAQRSLPSAT